MRLTYPNTLNHSYAGYPTVLRVICGPNITELNGPWVEGSVIYFFQTPLSKVQIGPYFDGALLPEYSVRYSDTGSESDYNIFLRVSGHGFFYEGDSGNWKLSNNKIFEIVSGYNGKHLVFTSQDLIYTNIPRDTPIPPNPPPTPPPKPPPNVPPTPEPPPPTMIPPDHQKVHDILAKNFFERFALNQISRNTWIGRTIGRYSKYEPVYVTRARVPINNITAEYLQNNYYYYAGYEDGFNDVTYSAVLYFNSPLIAQKYVVFCNPTITLFGTEFFIEDLFVWSSLTYRGIDWIRYLDY